jgi:hypothetical protein
MDAALVAFILPSATEVSAMGLLLDRIEGKLDGDAGKVLLEPRLVIRSSTTPPRGEASKQPQRRTLGV